MYPNRDEARFKGWEVSCLRTGSHGSGPFRSEHQKAGRNLDKGAGIGLLLAAGNGWSDLDNRVGCSGLNFFIGWAGTYIARDALLGPGWCDHHRFASPALREERPDSARRH